MTELRRFNNKYNILMRCIGGSFHQFTVLADSSYHAAQLVEETFPDKLVVRIAPVRSG